MKNKFNNMTDEIWKQTNELSKESREDFSPEQLAELRRIVQSMNGEIDVLVSGDEGAIELNPDDPSHVEWYNDSKDNEDE